MRIEVTRRQQSMPYRYVLMVGLLLIVAGLMMRSCEPEPLIAAENSYNDQRLDEAKLDRLAAELRRTSKKKYLASEDEDIEGIWPGQGRRK